jgi:hypothetical protein
MLRKDPHDPLTESKPTLRVEDHTYSSYDDKDDGSYSDH